ncbi:MAG: hypothetical protein ACR2HQ_07665 [Ilumatobacteraceae bacterium]
MRRKPPRPSGYLTPEDRDRLTTIRREIDDVFDDVIGTPARVALVGYPYDGNVGNHMMWLAIASYLRERRIRIAYAANLHPDPRRTGLHLDGLASAIGTDPILFVGGVSMSRLWPHHADAKRVIAERFNANRLISLTSTMLFADDEERHAASTMFAGHPDVTLLARDSRSAAEARQVFGDCVSVRAIHDSALRLQLEPSRPQGGRLLWLRRDDVESTAAAVDSEVVTFDWSNDLRAVDPVAYYAMRSARACSQLRSTRPGRIVRRPLNRYIVGAFGFGTRRIVAFGQRTLDQGPVLVTDRMHPHLLAVLRGQDVVLLPDRFGKNRATYESSTSGFSVVQWAEEPTEALRLATERLADRGAPIDAR